MEREYYQQSGSQDLRLRPQKSLKVGVVEEIEANLNSILMQYQNSEEQLKKTQTNFKIFLNMVIHDMRNPTNSIQHGLASVIKKLQKILKTESHHQNYSKSVAVLKNTLMEQDAEIFYQQFQSLMDNIDAQQDDSYEDINTMLQNLQMVAQMTAQQYNESQVGQDLQDDDIQEPEVIMPSIFSTNESCLQNQKRDKIYKEIEKIFEKEHINVDCEKFKASLNTFLRESCNGHKSLKIDSYVQTDDLNLDMLQSQKVEIEQRIKDIQEKVNERKNLTLSNQAKMKEMILPIQLNVRMYQSKQTLYQRQFSDFISYYDQIFEKIFKEAKNANNILQMQIFSQRMVENLINDLLDLAKLENNSFRLHNEYFDLADTIQEAYKILAYQATDRGITLDAKIDEPSKLKMIRSVYGDKRRFLQLMLNFLSNALKFTHQGGTVSSIIEIIDEQKMGEENFVNFRLGIKDTGVGITEENLKHLFIDFNRLAENEEMNKSGTGLGLSICKQIIEQMGGSVSVESKVGEGSTFFININTKYQCIVGDNILEQTFIKKLGNSLEVTSLLQEQNAYYEEIKDHEGDDEFFESHLSKVQILIEEYNQISSNNNSLVERNLIKSDSFAQIFEINDEHLEEQKNEEPSQRVLIANDEMFQLQILCDMFKGKQFTVTPAVNGHEAFTFVQKSLQSNKDYFDLIVLDLQMPISNGYETCRKILTLYDQVNEGMFNIHKSQLSERKQKPVMIACSGYVDEGIRSRTSESGFDLAIQCPLRSQKVEEIIMPLLSKRKENIENAANLRQQSGQILKAIRGIKSELIEKDYI